MNNIEEQFKNINEFSDFPNNGYISLYDQLYRIFKDTIHPEIKSKILEYEKEGYYNDHGIDHINMVIDRATKIICTFKENEKDFNLSNYELFFLLTAIHLHDAGHLIGKRKDHTHKVHELLQRNCNTLLSTAERKTIADIAKAHGGKEDPIGKLVEQDISGFEIRTKLLASILRLADELAEDKSRASLALLNLEDQKIDPPNTHIDKYSEIFHRFSQSLDSIRIVGNEIKISFCVKKSILGRKFEKKVDSDVFENVYLLDEIYARTYKTFLETLYCNRFFPSKSRFNIIKVKIDLLGIYDETFKTLSYELIEKGYPITEKMDTLIGEQIKEGDQILDGTYFADIVNKE